MQMGVPRKCTHSVSREVLFFMKKQLVAVVGDVVSPEFYFPVWYKYYASMFGGENIFLVTYITEIASFSSYRLGGVWRQPAYGNADRILSISSLISLLLEQYQYVIRVDVDEFLVADPRECGSLKVYVESLQRPYVTAEGIDVIQETAELALNLAQPILVRQRRFGYRYDAASKTCLTSIRMHWAPGFHFASVFPEFGRLYLFHMKRADVEIQAGIGSAIAERAPGEPNQPYYQTPIDRIQQYNRSICNFKRVSGWSQLDDTQYRSEFLKNVHYNNNYGGVYHGKTFRPEQVLVEFPHEFEGTI
jgi:hypothetical protein